MCHHKTSASSGILYCGLSAQYSHLFADVNGCSVANCVRSLIQQNVDCFNFFSLLCAGFPLDYKLNNSICSSYWPDALYSQLFSQPTAYSTSRLVTSRLMLLPRYSDASEFSDLPYPWRSGSHLEERTYCGGISIGINVISTRPYLTLCLILAEYITLFCKK